MPDQPPGDRAVILACSVRSLRRYWLEVRCGCDRSAGIPLRLIAANRTTAERTLDVVEIEGDEREARLWEIAELSRYLHGALRATADGAGDVFSDVT